MRGVIQGDGRFGIQYWQLLEGKCRKCVTKLTLLVAKQLLILSHRTPSEGTRKAVVSQRSVQKCLGEEGKEKRSVDGFRLCLQLTGQVPWYLQILWLPENCKARGEKCMQRAKGKVLMGTSHQQWEKLGIIVAVGSWIQTVSNNQIL